MNKAKSLMKQVHNQQQASPNLTQSKEVLHGVKPEPTTPRPPAPKPQPAVAPVIKPTAVNQIARDDVPYEFYGIKPVTTNFNCYNKDLFKWLQSFSSDNQFNGGVAITKSQLFEIVLDVIKYDLDINPIGYESQQALREDIQNRIKGNY